MKVALWCAVALLVGSYICLSVADPDLWWHIAIGKWIIAHGNVPVTDHWNMFGGELPWRAYSWSFEVLVAAIERTFGVDGLLLAQLGLGVLLATTLQATFGIIAKDKIIGCIFGVYSTVACYNHFTLRPQVLVWILYAALLGVLESARRRNSMSVSSLFAVAGIGSLWANTHLTAALGLGSIVLWMAPERLDVDRVKKLAALAIAFFIGTLCTPYLGGEWITFFAKSGHPLRYSVIAEFQPATILQYSTIFVLLLLVFMIVVAFTTRTVPSFGRSVLAGGMVIAGLTAVKFLPFAAIVLGALVCQWWCDVQSTAASTNDEGGDRGRREGIVEGFQHLKRFLESLSPTTYGALAFFVLAIGISSISNLRKAPLDLSYVPKSSVDFITANNLSHPILNEFGAGGYLMYRFSDDNGEPRHKVAIDGRTNVNPPEVWQMYQESFLGKIGWRNFISKVQPKTILWRQGSAFVSLLYTSKEWCRVFSSGERESDYVVFVSREDFEGRGGSLTSNNCAPKS